MNFVMRLGIVVKKFRSENNLTMQEFANMSGLSKGYISMLEKGKHPQNNREIIPSIETVLRIAKAMNLSLDELLDCEWQIQYQPQNIAAHHDDEYWTDEELAEIEAFKNYIKSKRNK